MTGARETQAAQEIRLEPSPRWVRAYFGGIAVADSKRVVLVYEPERLATYWFPVEDVRMDLFKQAHNGAVPESGTLRWTLQVGDRVAENAARSYPDNGSLKGYIALFWNQMDAWYEEDDEVLVHPRDPYHRVDVLHSSRSVRIELEGQVVAETARPSLLFETGLPTRYYIPRLDVRMDLLEPTDSSTSCPYKGVASYWSLRLGNRVVQDLVWSYPFPIPECPKIENLLSFYNEKVDVYVDGELQVRPQTRWS